jgi:hypothetical protein
MSMIRKDALAENRYYGETLFFPQIMSGISRKPAPIALCDTFFGLTPLKAVAEAEPSALPNANSTEEATAAK